MPNLKSNLGSGFDLLHSLLDDRFPAPQLGVRQHTDMSITIDYFFNSGKDFRSLTKDINLWIGTNFQPYKGDENDQFCRFLGLELDLNKHTLSNDGDCNFQDFKFQIGSRTSSPDSGLRQIQLEMMALLAFAMYKKLRINDGLLVFDAQIALAKYTLFEGKWHDKLSGKDVHFPEHLHNIGKRITRDGWK